MDETLGGGMDEVNRAVGRFVKEAYRTAWRAEDQSERKRIIEILKRATEELENVGTARQA